MHKEWQKFRTPSMPINPTSTTVDVPRLENLTSGHSSRLANPNPC